MNREKENEMNYTARRAADIRKKVNSYELTGNVLDLADAYTLILRVFERSKFPIEEYLKKHGR